MSSNSYQQQEYHGGGDNINKRQYEEDLDWLDDLFSGVDNNNSPKPQGLGQGQSSQQHGLSSSDSASGNSDQP